MVKDWRDYKDLDYLIIIPSKGRSKKISRVEEIFPNAVLLINEDELEDYKNTTFDILTHKKTKGFGSVLNEIFNQCKKHNIRYSAVFDDDKHFFGSLVGNRQRMFTPEQIEQSIVNGCQQMEDLDLGIYLFSTCSSIIKYQQNEPFKVGFSLPQGAWIFRNEYMGKYNETLHYYDDFDFCMDYIKKHKFMLIENRTLCLSKGELNVGGCNSFRTSSNEKYSHNYIKKKWGDYANFVTNSSGTKRPTAVVQFRQNTK